MKMTVMVAVAVLVGCDAVDNRHEDPRLAFASSFTRIENGEVICVSPDARYDAPSSGPPFISSLCGWDCRIVGGERLRSISVLFERASGSDPWTGPMVSTQSTQTEECAGFR